MGLAETGGKTTDGAIIPVKHYWKHVWELPEWQEHYERKVCPFELATVYYAAGLLEWLTNRNFSKTRDDKAILLKTAQGHVGQLKMLLSTLNFDLKKGSDNIADKQSEEWPLAVCIGMQRAQILGAIFGCSCWAADFSWLTMLRRYSKSLAIKLERRKICH